MKKWIAAFVIMCLLAPSAALAAKKFSASDSPPTGSSSGGKGAGDKGGKGAGDKK